MKRALIAATALVLSAAAWLPAQAFAGAHVDIVVREAPPPPRYEVVPGPRHGYVWSPGYWNWNGRRYVWIGGHWERLRPGYAYHRPEWRHGERGWHLNRGGWQRRAYADRDRDGVPNRFDRRPVNPYRR
jgi:hypothetical protein